MLCGQGRLNLIITARRSCTLIDGVVQLILSICTYLAGFVLAGLDLAGLGWFRQVGTAWNEARLFVPLWITSQPLLMVANVYIVKTAIQCPAVTVYPLTRVTCNKLKCSRVKLDHSCHHHIDCSLAGHVRPLTRATRFSRLGFKY